MKYFYIIIISILIFGCNSSIVADPKLSIQFGIPESSYVKVTVVNNYNSIMFASEERLLSPGYHSYSVDTSESAEGLYYSIIEVRELDGEKAINQGKITIG
jgi:hypothetical protein